MKQNLTPYALGAIGIVLVAAFLSVVPLGLALVFVVIVILGMGEMRSRENKARHEEQLRQWHMQNRNPEQGWEPPPSLARPSKSAWSAAGSLLAILAAVGGLAILGMVVLLVVTVSSGNFKLGNK
jgi:hypothetical protein